MQNKCPIALVKPNPCGVSSLIKLHTVHLERNCMSLKVNRKTDLFAQTPSETDLHYASFTLKMLSKYIFYKKEGTLIYNNK